MFRERVPFPTAKYMIAAVIGGFGYNLYQDLDRGDHWSTALLFSSVVAAAIAVICLLVWSLPVIGEGKSVTVDTRGMRIAGRRLPAEAIGQVREVRDPGLRGYGFHISIDGEKIPWTRLFVHGSNDRAVLVEDLRDTRRGRRRRYWAVQPRDMQGLVYALHRTRDAQ